MAFGEDLEIVQWNCRNLCHNKTPLHQYLLTRPSLPHFLLLQETRTARNVPGYRAYHATTATPLASIYVRSDVLVEQIDIPSTLLKYLVCVVYYHPSSRISLVLLSFYNPPVTSSLFSALGKFLHSLPSTSHLLFGGDFNAPHTLWGYPQTLKPGRLLHCLAQERHLTLLNTPGSPTRAGIASQRSTTPDLTFSRGSLSFHWQVTAETLLSDHFLIHITTSLSHIPRCHPVIHTDWHAFRTNLASDSFQSYDDWTSRISAALTSSSRRVRSRYPIQDPDPHLIRLWRRRTSSTLLSLPTTQCPTFLPDHCSAG